MTSGHINQCKICLAAKNKKRRKKLKELGIDINRPKEYITIENKLCAKCNNIKSIDEFTFCKKNKSGHYSYCKDCLKEIYEENKEKILVSAKRIRTIIANSECLVPPEHKTCPRCKFQKSVNEFGKYKYSRDKHRNICLNCSAEEARNEHCKQMQRIRDRKRIATDPKYRLRKLVKRRIKHMLQGECSGESMLKYLDYTLKDLKLYLESQFEPWMNWNNWGTYDSRIWDDKDQSTWTWQIDHITPQSSFLYDSMDHPNFKKCWALENLRPFNAKQNVRDGNRR